MCTSLSVCLTLALPQRQLTSIIQELYPFYSKTTQLCGPPWGIAKGNFLRGSNPNLPTKKTSLKPNLPIKKALLAIQSRPALFVYCKYADKLNFGGAAPPPPQCPL